jgi:hypothetical protein
VSNATLTEWDNGRHDVASGGISMTVDFDPQSLEVSYTVGSTSPGTTGRATGSGTENRSETQQTTQRSTLGLTLMFDTSREQGISVQSRTDPLVTLTRGRKSSGDTRTHPVLRFQWGAFLFYGSIDSMTQTIDFFSDAGVPLRASVRLSLTEVADPPPRSTAGGSGAAAGLGASFGASAGIGASAGVGASAGFGASAAAGGSASLAASGGVVGSAGFGGSAGVGTAPLTLSRDGDSIQTIAARTGASWRAVAAANGIDNPRLVAAGTVLAAGGQVAMTGQLSVSGSFSGSTR